LWHRDKDYTAVVERHQARRTLERAAAINDDIPPPPMPGHHFQKDKDQQEKVEMSVAMALGDNSRAIELADAPRPEPPRPPPSLREGDLDEATAIGESVFEMQRQGIPEIMRQTEELADLLADFKPAGSFLDGRFAASR
jgi:hypothetical protein